MNVFDLFEYDNDPENEGVEKLRFHLKRNRFKSLEKPKLHKHSHRIGEQDVEETASMTKGMKSNHDAFKMQEARKPDVNFDIEDIKRLEQIKDLATLKTQAMALIAKPSAKPMRPEKVEWFRSSLERMDSPMKVIKLMYDLMLSGEGHQVIGSRRSMNPNSYRSRFGETVLNPKDMHGDYDAKRKALHDLSRDPNVDQKEVTQRRLDLDKEAKAKGVTESSAGAKYKIKSIGKDKNGDYYISPNTGKKVYKQAKVGDHETPRGEVKPKVAESNEPRFLDDDFYAYDPETMEIKDTWSHKSVGRRHSEYRARQEGWSVVSGMRAKSLGLHYPNSNNKPDNTGLSEAMEEYLYELELAGYEIVNEGRMQCPECGGVAYADQMLAEKKDACYSKVKSRYKVWPSAYASGALTRCRKVGAANWGNKSKK